MSLGLTLRIGSGDLITGGNSAGEVFAEFTPLGAFILVNSLILPSAREVRGSTAFKVQKDGCGVPSAARALLGPEGLLMR